MALLFSVVSFLERHKDQHSQSCTDIECVWDKPRKSSQPMEVDDINIAHDQSAVRAIEPTPTHYMPVSTDEADQRNLEVEVYNLFSTHKPSSLLLLTLDPPSNESSFDDGIATITMQEAMSTCSSGTDVEAHLRNIFTNEVIQEIELITQGQADNSEWFAHRKGRVTASLFSSVMNFRFNDSPQNYILKLVMSEGNTYRSPSLAFGKDNEPIARQMYFEQCKKKHKCFKVNTCGLFIDENHPYIGASPDGIVSCSCCGKGVIEVKCSYTYQNETPQAACDDKHYHLFKDESDAVRLKPSSSWYLQIQGQMGVCKVDYCDFVFFTKKGIIVDRILFDQQVYKDIVMKCKKFCDMYIVNALKYDTTK